MRRLDIPGPNGPISARLYVPPLPRPTRRHHCSSNTTAARRHSGLIHAFVNRTGVNRTALAAVLEACGALRLGLAPASPQAV